MREKQRAECRTPDCGKPVLAKQLCQSCYSKSRRVHNKARKTDKDLRCTIEGCNNALTRSGVCQRHYLDAYMERRRAQIAKGEIAPRLVPKSLNNCNGYLVGYVPDHPLANAALQLYEHRRVAYEKYGPGSQTCHWCETPLTWKQVEVDHLDWKRDNNDPDNLVTACPACNKSRTERNEVLKKPAPVDTKGLMALAKKLNR